MGLNWRYWLKNGSKYILLGTELVYERFQFPYDYFKLHFILGIEIQCWIERENRDNSQNLRRKNKRKKEKGEERGKEKKISNDK